MISPFHKNALKSQWGEAMHAMHGFAWVRLTGLDDQAFYLLAMNPEDEDEVLFIPDHFKPQPPEIGSFRDLQALLTYEGDSPYIDEEYQPQLAKELFKRLGGQIDR